MVDAGTQVSIGTAMLGALSTFSVIWIAGAAFLFRGLDRLTSKKHLDSLLGILVFLVASGVGLQALMGFTVRGLNQFAIQSLQLALSWFFLLTACTQIFIYVAGSIVLVHRIEPRWAAWTYVGLLWGGLTGVTYVLWIFREVPP
jgi:hypothetical protein